MAGHPLLAFVPQPKIADVGKATAESLAVPPWRVAVVALSRSFHCLLSPTNLSGRATEGEG
jgi:hypothetical protein